MATLMMTLLTVLLASGAPLPLPGAAAEGAPPCCAGHAHGEHNHDEDAPKTPGELLDRLEHQAGNLRAFTAEVVYEHFDDLLGRRETRTGTILYKVDEATKAPSFAVLFDRLIVGNRGQDQQKHYIFADRWLVEVDHAARQFIKRELVPPGRQIDPLKLGEGPIPLPIGQKREEVEQRFEVSFVALPAEPPLSRLQNVNGLRLVPKEGAPEAREYRQVDLFYDRGTGLPIGILAIEANGNRKTVRLANVAHNPELTDEQLAKLNVEEPDPREWAIDVERWRASN